MYSDVRDDLWVYVRDLRDGTGILDEVLYVLDIPVPFPRADPRDSDVDDYYQCVFPGRLSGVPCYEIRIQDRQVGGEREPCVIDDLVRRKIPFVAHHSRHFYLGVGGGLLDARHVVCDGMESAEVYERSMSVLEHQATLVFDEAGTPQVVLSDEQQRFHLILQRMLGVIP